MLQQQPVVADQQIALPALDELLLQPLPASQVEMIAGFIQDQQLRRLQQCAHQRNAHALPSAQVVHRHIDIHTVQAGIGQGLLQIVTQAPLLAHGIEIGLLRAAGLDPAQCIHHVIHSRKFSYPLTRGDAHLLGEVMHPADTPALPGTGFA
ncbi:hypothetical protein D3C81_817300 [compost metagenome]